MGLKGEKPLLLMVVLLWALRFLPTVHLPGKVLSPQKVLTKNNTLQSKLRGISSLHWPVLAFSNSSCSRDA